MSYRPCVVNHDAYSRDRIQLHTRSKRTRICTGRSLNAQVATRALNMRVMSLPMQNAAGHGIAFGPDGQNDSYRSVVSDLVSLIEHVQASLQRIEQSMVPETSSGGQEAANVVVLDDVSPRYARAAAALKACDANLGIALHFLLDSSTSGRGTSAYEVGPDASM